MEVFRKFVRILPAIENDCFLKNFKLENTQLNMLSSFINCILSVVDSDELSDGDTA